MSSPVLRSPVQTPTEARWSCRACGSCCHLNRLGPVEPEIIEGLVARRIEDHWPAAAAQPWRWEEPGPDGQAHTFLAHTEGHCVFLRDDQLCAIHALFGAQAKPGFCREYPLHVVEDAGGLKMIARDDCGGLHRSFSDGEPLDAQVEEALALPRVVPRRVWTPREVLALPDLRVAGSVWVAWEGELLAQLDALRDDPPAPELLVSRLRAQLFGLAQSEASEADPLRYGIAVRAALEGVFRALSAAHASSPPTTSDWERNFIRENLETIGRARERMATDWSTLDQPLSLDARRYLCLVLRGQILGKQIHALGGVAEGLGSWLLDTAIARAGQPEGEDPIAVGPLGHALSRWRKLSLNAMMQRILRLTRPALVDAFLNAEA